MSKTTKIIFIFSLIANLGIVYVAYNALEYRAHINYFLDKYTNVVEEFSGRHVYATDNERYKSDALIENRVVFIGSQFTLGWNLKESFPELEVINRGISGQRVSGYILRFVPDVIELHPAAVVIEFASYNFRPQYSLKEFQDYISIMAQLARTNNIEPVLTTVIPTRSNSQYEGYAVKDSVVKYNEWLKEFCAKNNYHYLDYFQILAGQNGLLPDSLSISNIELNPAGYKLITSKTKQILTQLLIDKKTVIHK